MIAYRPMAQLGRTSTAGLKAWHHFSFAGYQDARYMNWGRLRVLNHYILKAGSALPAAFHAASELLFVVSGGKIEIRKCGERPIAVQAGEIASVSSGIGTEFGIASGLDQDALYSTIWLRADPNECRSHYRGVVGSFASKDWIAADESGRDISLHWEVPARVRVMHLADQEALLVLRGASSYLTVLQGEMNIGEQAMRPFDAAMVSGPAQFDVTACAGTRLLTVESQP